MMFKIEFENWLMVHEAITNDFATALDDLAVCFEDETACGHIIDLETGEVLVHIENGAVAYISEVVLVALMELVADGYACDVVMWVLASHFGIV